MPQGLRDEIKSFSRLGNPLAYPLCKLEKFLEGLSKEKVKQFRAAVMDPDLEAAAIARYFQTLGYKGTKDTIARHRRDAGCRACKDHYGDR